MFSKRVSRAIAACVAGALALMGASSAAFGDERSDLVKQQQQHQATMEDLRASLGKVDDKMAKALDQLEETQGKLPAAQDALEKAQAELATAQREQESVAARLQAAQGELAGIRGEIAEADKKLEGSRAQLGAVARAQYRGETGPQVTDILFGSASTEDFINAYNASQTAARTQSSMVTELSRARATAQNRESRQTAVESEVRELKAKADKLVAERDAKQAEAAKKKADLEKLEASIKETSKQLESKKAEIDASINNEVKQQQATANRIAQIDAENARRAAAAAAAEAARQRQAAAEAARQRQAAAARNAAPAAPAAPAARGGAGSSGGVSSNPTGFFMTTPVPRPLVVTSPFGMRIYPFDGQRWMHQGVDLRSRCGEPQVAVADGTIVSTIPAAGNGTHGNQIYLNLGNVQGHSWVVVHNHLSQFLVRPGQHVKKGQPIGLTGTTGLSTGCHVHFEVWRDGHVINPMSLPGY